MSDLWVFGYGSLMWRPGFDYVDQVPALLIGAHRALCVLSHTHRGTPERPGLVLGLDRGGSCKGVAFRVAPENGESVMRYLRKRELDTTAYIETRRVVRLEDPAHQPVKALLYVVDRADPQYAGNLSREEALEIVRQGRGHSGHNRDYVINTAHHLAKIGIHDPVLAWLTARLRQDAD